MHIHRASQLISTYLGISYISTYRTRLPSKHTAYTIIAFVQSKSNSVENAEEEGENSSQRERISTDRKQSIFPTKGQNKTCSDQLKILHTHHQTPLSFPPPSPSPPHPPSLPTKLAPFLQRANNTKTTHTPTFLNHPRHKKRRPHRTAYFNCHHHLAKPHSFIQQPLIVHSFEIRV